MAASIRDVLSRKQMQEDMEAQEQARQMAMLNQENATATGQVNPDVGPTPVQTPFGLGAIAPQQELKNRLNELLIPYSEKYVSGGMPYEELARGVSGLPGIKEQAGIQSAQSAQLESQFQKPTQVDLGPIAGFLGTMSGKDYSQLLSSAPKEQQALRQKLQEAVTKGQQNISDDQLAAMKMILTDITNPLAGLRGSSKDPEQALRKEFNALKVIKNTSEVQQSYNKIRNASRDVSAAGDLSMVFAFMKMLDPDSVVRESEQATAQNARGVPDKIRNTWNQILSGQRLAPAQREDFLRQADNLLQAQITAQKDAEKMYTTIAQSKGIDPSKVIIKYKEEKKTDKTKAPEGKVEVINPDGKRVRISSAQLDSALRQGYRKP